MQTDMKIMRLGLILCGISCRTLESSPKSRVLYEYEYCVSTEGQQGQVISNKTIGIADTTIAWVQGKIVGPDGNLPYASVSFFNKSRNQNFGVLSDANGEYKRSLLRGKYEVTFQSMGYRNFIIKDFALRTGQMQEIQVKLGEGGGFKTVAIKSRKPLTPKQIRKRAMQITKQK